MRLSKDRVKITKYLKKRVKDYPKYINSGPGEDSDPIRFLALGFYAEQGGCHAVLAPGSNVTLAPTARAGASGWNSGSIRTVPVNHSAGPLKQREKTITAAGNMRIPEALDRLIELYSALDKPDEVSKWKAERATYPATDPTVPFVKR